jgi:hypothetical protein
MSASGISTRKHEVTRADMTFRPCKVGLDSANSCFRVEIADDPPPLPRDRSREKLNPSPPPPDGAESILSALPLRKASTLDGLAHGHLDLGIHVLPKPFAPGALASRILSRWTLYHRLLIRTITSSFSIRSRSGLGHLG